MGPRKGPARSSLQAPLQPCLHKLGQLSPFLGHADKAASLSSKSVLLTAKFIESVVRKNYGAKKPASGDILIEVRNLLKQTTTAALQITVTPHRTVSSRPGVISETELISGTEADIHEGLCEQAVTAVRHTTVRRNKNEIKTKHVILTFDHSALPESLKACFLHCQIRQYIPNMQRCF